MNPIQQCAVTNARGTFLCHQPGGYCTYDEYITRPMVCSTAAGIVTSTSKENLLCEDATTATFCAPGYYCNNGTSRLCDAGHFCPMGTADQIECTFPLLTCPQSGTKEQFQTVLFGALLLIFCLILWLYGVYSRFQIRNGSLAKWNEVAKVVNTNTGYDTVNELVLEHNQRVMVQATEDLYQSMVARERAITSAKVNHRIDEDEVLPINRFSVGMRRLNTGQSYNFSFSEVTDSGAGDEEEEETEKHKNGTKKHFMQQSFYGGVLCSPEMGLPGVIDPPQFARINTAHLARINTAHLARKDTSPFTRDTSHLTRNDTSSFARNDTLHLTRKGTSPFAKNDSSHLARHDTSPFAKNDSTPHFAKIDTTPHVTRVDTTPHFATIASGKQVTAATPGFGISHAYSGLMTPSETIAAITAANAGAGAGGGADLNTKNATPATRKTSLVRTGTVQRVGMKLVTQLQANMQHYQYDDVPTPLTLSFMDMNLVLKASGATVLRNICVSIHPFNVTAIMGPSGAGKTTFLSLLRGQAHYAQVTGSMTVNGFPVQSLERLKTHTAYVPQDDIVNDELSVEENIRFAALLFNKRGHLRIEEVMPMVVQAERLLDIVHIRTSVVGSPLNRGISGGQKKRVSIAMELMKEAELFFLDEPTSGLDSASSMLVVNALHFLASKGVKVITTIHQPRQEILSLMDNLLLLAPGGRVTYFGPIIDLHFHFSQLNYTCPVGINIADFVMDLLCGFVPEDGDSEVRDVQETIKVLCDWWEENRYPAFALNLSQKGGTQNKIASLEALEARVQSATEDRAWRYHWVTQNIKVFVTCFRRQMKVNQRRIDSISVTCMLLLGFGIVVAFLSGVVDLSGTGGSMGSFSSQITSGALVFSLLVQSASLKLFTDDKLLRNREFTAGLQIGPYFLGKILGNFIEPCFYAFAFLTGNYPFIKARAPFIEYWYCFFLLHLAISGLVNFLAVAYPGSNTGTFAVGAAVLMWSFGGISPSITAMEDSMSVFATIVNAVSPFNYAFQIEVINEIQMYPNVWNPEKLLERFNYRSVDRDPCIISLVLYWFISNLLAYLVAEFTPHWPRIKKDTQELIFHLTDGRLCSSKADTLASTTEYASSSERSSPTPRRSNKESPMDKKASFSNGAIAVDQAGGEPSRKEEVAVDLQSGPSSDNLASQHQRYVQGLLLQDDDDAEEGPNDAHKGDIESHSAHGLVNEQSQPNVEMTLVAVHMASERLVTTGGDIEMN
eukprot:gene18695-21275_t